MPKLRGKAKQRQRKKTHPYRAPIRPGSPGWRFTPSPLEPWYKSYDDLKDIMCGGCLGDRDECECPCWKIEYDFDEPCTGVQHSEFRTTQEAREFWQTTFPDYDFDHDVFTVAIWDDADVSLCIWDKSPENSSPDVPFVSVTYRPWRDPLWHDVYRLIAQAATHEA